MPLLGAADPAHVDAAHEAGHRTVESELRSANQATLHPTGIAATRPQRGDDRPLPSPRPIAGPPVPRHDAIEVPPQQAQQAQALIGPKLAESAAAGAARAQAAVDRAQARVAGLHQRRDQSAHQAAQQQAAVRARSQQRADGLRGQWQQANAQLHAEHSARVETRRVQVPHTAQHTLQAGEHEADQALTHTESAANQHLADARARAAAARAVAAWTGPRDWILVKASRGMRLERAVEALSALLK